MWNDPIVDETRQLRDEYSAKHGYNIHAMVEDLRQWELDGFPMTANRDMPFKPEFLLSTAARQTGG